VWGASFKRHLRAVDSSRLGYRNRGRRHLETVRAYGNGGAGLLGEPSPGRVARGSRTSSSTRTPRMTNESIEQAGWSTVVLDVLNTWGALKPTPCFKACSSTR